MRRDGVQDPQLAGVARYPGAEAQERRRPHGAGEPGCGAAREAQLGRHGPVHVLGAQLGPGGQDLGFAPTQQPEHVDGVAPGIHEGAPAEGRSVLWRVDRKRIVAQGWPG